ncbi:PREDICTED: B3 domain-containing protein At3g17010-like [Brassica oleracea var. oleracea]|uniref:B3 domain-containing protein At3g17010-like n=1 Tax=Brassica oleracea var. oleracea TaxID=109376 RepID=UPI0006A6E4B8|nr:PREDICTED: B3 domain-containing protein At3g17010-like [Brassica oleracea var. oleracea]
MGWNRGFGRVKDERKNLSFFKIFQSADLFSESMRAMPYNFMKNISKEDFSYKMVIRAQWGSSWEVDISMNPRFYYMEKSGWNQFVTDNALGENEFVTFTHKGLMRFNVNIYGKNGKEIVTPRKPHTTTPFSGIKKEEDVKKEDESMGVGVEIEVQKKKRAVEVGESSRGAALKKKKAEKPKPSNKKKKKMKRKKVKNGVPEFEITITNSYLKFLAIPKKFEEAYIPDESKVYMIHHSEGKGSWEVFCLVRQTRTIFSSGWCRLAREYPLSVGDRCTFHLVKPDEFVLTTKKAREEITVIE